MNIDERPVEASDAPDVPLASIGIFHASDVRPEEFIRFDTETAPGKSQLQESLAPDVPLASIGISHAPDVQLAEFVRFDTETAPGKSQLRESLAPDVALAGIGISHAPDVRLAEFVRFDTETAPGKSQLRESLAPDIALASIGIFHAPDVRLEEFIRFETEAPPRKSQLREWCESLAFTIIFILIFTNYVAQATQVPTESMKPTILVGDHFFIDKVSFPGNFPALIRPYLPHRSIKHGDIIVFKSPVEGNIPFVKRVIGMAGDKIEIRNKNVYINGQKHAEPYKIHIDSSVYRDDRWTPDELKIRDNYGPLTVPPNSFFVMGDNRDNSNDSRYWGFVDGQSVMGKPLFVYWSYESDPYIGPDQSLKDWVTGYLSIGIHFFSRTRWFRIGTMVE